MSSAMRITGGKVYDPANGIDGQVRDVLVHDGKIVESLPEGTSVRTIAGNGCVIMPGGVDIHCHIASSSVNRARAIRGEEHASHVHEANALSAFRAGSGTLTPSTFTTGYRYAALGYTSALEAAVAPSAARHTQLELADTPNIDAGYLVLLANHQRLIELIAAGDTDGAVAFVGHVLSQTGAYGIKVVNPGGVASWRCDPAHTTINSLDDRVAGTNATPRAILETLATAADRLKLPHAPHVHGNRLGLAGNVEITLDTLAALAGRRVHMTHLQFHAYGQSKAGQPTSAAHRLCDYFNQHKHATADVGQVVFGDAMTLTADTPLEHLLWKLIGRPSAPYISIESEMETGCGIMPVTYSDRNYMHSLQWAIGLELLLGCDDPWRMLLSTDHPNGGSFLAYPRIIAALMSRAVRDEQLRKSHPRAVRSSRLKDLGREMTLSEIAVITRAGPARVLGMKHKGQLGPGADADITLYHDNPADPQAMFESPRYVIKAGRVLVDDGELRDAAPGTHHRAHIETDSDRGRRELEAWFNKHGSYSVKQFGLAPRQLAAMPTVRG